MAMLGFMQKCISRSAPKPLHDIFQFAPAPVRALRSGKNRHPRHLQSWIDGNQTDILFRSVLGMVDTYNALPAYIALCDNIEMFQLLLQEKIKIACADGVSNWQCDIMQSLLHKSGNG